MLSHLLNSTKTPKMKQLIVRLIDKFLCLHLWKTHIVKSYEWETEVISLASEKDKKIILIRKEQSTKEILFCEHCGKTKILEY